MSDIYSTNVLIYEKAFHKRIPHTHIHISEMNKIIILEDYIEDNSDLDIKILYEKCKKLYDLGKSYIFYIINSTLNFDIEDVKKYMVKLGLEPPVNEEMYEKNKKFNKLIYNAYLRETFDRYQTITNIKNELSNKNFTPLAYESKTVKSNFVYDVYIEDKNWDIKNIKETINNSILSLDIPFIFSETDNGNVYKVFKYKDFTYHNFLSFVNETQIKKNLIYLYIWDKNKLNYKNSYYECKLDVMNMTFEIYTYDMADISDQYIELIEQTIPFIKLINGKTFSVNSITHISDININYPVFYYMCDNDPILSNFLILFENTNTRDYKNFSSDFEWRDFVVDSDRYNKRLQTVVSIETVTGETSTFAKCNILRAASDDDSNNISNILSYLFSYYKYNEYKYIKYLENYVVLPEKKKVKYDIPTSKIESLKRYYPEMFGKNNYARKCLSERQPIIIDEDEIDSWKKMSIDGVERSIGEYPPHPLKKNEEGKWEKVEGFKPLFYYICPNDKLSHPSLIKVDDEEESEYPYLPCCNNTDNLSKYYNSNTGKIAEYYGYEEKRKKVSILKRTGKLNPKNYGFLPEYITMHLYMASVIDEYISNQKSRSTIHKNSSSGNGMNSWEESEADSYLHMGIDTNYHTSFISCILKAVGYENKITHDTVRKKIASMHIGLYMQELVGVDANIIRNILLYDWADPFIFYRGLEELFNINIYILNSETEELQLPSHHIMYIRTFRKRKTVLIWYHPQERISELIIYTPQTTIKGCKKKTMLFDKSINQRMFKTQKRDYINMNCYKFYNIFRIFNWETIISKFGTIKSQYIDNYGKMRGLTIKINDNDHMTIFFPPSQPLNISNDFKVYGLKLDDAINMMGKEPESIIEEGYWFSYQEIDKFIFIPNETIGIETNPLYTSNDVIYDEFVKKDNIDNLINKQKEILWWAYLSNRESININSMNSFIDMYVRKSAKSSSPTCLNLDIYKLPKVYTSRDAINELGGLIGMGGLSTISIIDYDNIIYFLKKMSIELSGLKIEPARYLSKPLNNEDDYNQLDSKVFLKSENMQTWIESQSINKCKIDLSKLSDEPVNIIHGKYGSSIIQKASNIQEAAELSILYEKEGINYSGIADRPVVDIKRIDTYTYENNNLVLNSSGNSIRSNKKSTYNGIGRVINSSGIFFAILE